MSTTDFLSEIVVKSSLILCAAWALAFALRRRTAAVRHMVWTAGLVGVLVLPVVVVVGPAWQLNLVRFDVPSAVLLQAGLIRPATPADPMAAAGDAAPSSSVVDATPAMAADSRIAIEPDALSSPLVAQSGISAVRWDLWLAAVWMLGAAIGLIRLGAGLLWAARIARAGRRVTDGGWLSLLREVAGILHVRGAVRLIVSDRVTVPAVCGVFRPTVLLPPSSQAWNEDRKRVVLLHEVAHVRRRDCLMQALAQLACACYWFNPLVLMAAARARAEQERACDDVVLDAGIRRTDYANHLYDLVVAVRGRAFPVWATLGMARSPHLESRLAAILDGGRSRRRPSRRVVVGIAAAACAVVLSVGAAKLSAGAVTEPGGPEPAGTTAHHVVPAQRNQAQAASGSQSSASQKIGTVRISDIDLASRVSFFLWSSIPDDQLLELAAAGKLRTPAVLEQQVKRMLADPRAKALIENFAGQWLQTRKIETVMPVEAEFPEFDGELRDAMKQETERFFGSQLREDRPVIELLTANYTFLNERLARHYGVPSIVGSHFRRVDMSKAGWPGDQRVGILGHGSVLTLTSQANRTSPVLRGKYILDNILGAPVPPPPTVVPEFKGEGEDGQTLTVRQALEQHRSSPVCANCHARMDPWGFALENFDAIGRWRENDWKNGEWLDVAVTLADGTKLEGPTGIRQVLLARRDMVVQNITQKLMTYGLGREVMYYDLPAVRKIVREAAPLNHRWSSLILGVVNSMPFQYRGGE
jgi:beta-lactamase regulating signal transducer with metallopeptidase domain